jgi:hypothetical protein
MVGIGIGLLFGRQQRLKAMCSTGLVTAGIVNAVFI